MTYFTVSRRFPAFRIHVFYYHFGIQGALSIAKNVKLINSTVPLDVQMA